MKYILYHENNSKHPYYPQEDSYFHSEEDLIFVVADGVTHDPSDISAYPLPSDSYEVARIVCREVVSKLNGKDFSTDSVRDAYRQANKAVADFNVQRPLFRERENNGFTIGAATTAMVWIKDYKLIYGVVDDCFISIFGEDMQDHPMLKSYVSQSAKYLDSHFRWEEMETRRHWREDVRNHKIVVEGKEYGYGAIDGRDGYETYLQMGEEDLKPGDLVCVYTDGFIKLMSDTNLIKGLKNNSFTTETYERISSAAKAADAYKEKTAYFIKVE